MADATNTTPAADKAPAPKTVIDDMDSRRVFANSDDAVAYLTACKSDFTDFASYPVAAAGLTEEGDFDPEVYNDSMDVAVAVLTERGEGKNSSRVKAIVVFPAPKLEAVLESAQGREWLTGIMQKELNHVAVRQLRKATSEDEIADAIQTMPTSLEAYTTSGRESTGGILQAYNDLWQPIKKAIAEKSKPFAVANLSKKELRKAMESASYASAVYPSLENRTNKAGENASWFKLAATFGQVLAKNQGLDPTIFDRMLSTRDEKKIDVADDSDDADFDFEAMAQAVAKKDDEAPAADSTDEAPAADATQDTDGAAS